MWLWRIICVVALVSLTPSAASCQPPGRSLFFEALREAFEDSPNKEIFDLVNHAPVREHVKLDDAELQQLRGHMRDAMDELRTLADASRDQPAPPSSGDQADGQPADPKANSHCEEERAKQADWDAAVETLKLKILEVVSPYDAKAFELLKEKSDFERLVQLFVQSRGYSSAISSEVSSRIGMSEAERVTFQEVVRVHRKQVMKDTRAIMEERIRRPSADTRMQIGKLFEEARDKVNARVAEELTTEQREKLEALKGEPFEELPHSGGGSRRKGPGGREHGGPASGGEHRGPTSGERGGPRGER